MGRVARQMTEAQIKARSMLIILLATCQTTLTTLQAADNPVDGELTGLLGEMVERTQGELAKLKAAIGDEG
jgi:hypothetical protein